MRWHLYCRVVDNLGDIGFAWRLAADLAARGEAVRLAADDAAALAWMAPEEARSVEIAGWNDLAEAPADVVVELFGGGVAEPVARTAPSQESPPLHIDVEHLSAESFVERAHGLPSPGSGNDGKPAMWYFYPGFNERTGGLAREPGLLARRNEFDAGRWLASLAIETRAGERRVSVFSYPNPALGELLDALADAPTLVLLTPGFALEQARAHLGPTLTRGMLRGHALPLLSQRDFDRLLWSCDLNCVRGEDSLVRAIWAGAPFLWQLYGQEDEAQAPKLEAFLDRFLVDAPPALAATLRSLFRRWNGSAEAPIRSVATALADRVADAWLAHCRQWRDKLAAESDLVTRLLEFVGSKR